MAARRYEISLRVFQHKKFRTIFLKWLFFCCERLVLLCRHSNSDLFTCEDNTYSCNMYFHVWRYHDFVRKLKWYFTSVYSWFAGTWHVGDQYNKQFFFYGFYMKMELHVHSQRREALLFLITNMAAVTSSANRQCTSIRVPWVPETFLARFPVSVKSL